jgi:hypothetical protein
MGVAHDAAARRPLIRHCVDWTEQRHHLAGLLGAGLASHLFAAGWIVRGPIGRAVQVTDTGVRALSAHFELECARFR